MNKGIHYQDGRWVDGDKVTVSAFDISLLRGYGVFDFLRTYGNKPFRLNDHLQRFVNSVKKFKLRLPLTKEKLGEIIIEGIAKNDYQETNVRMILTGGVSKDSLTPGRSSLIILFTPSHPYPSKYYRQGIKVITKKYVRPDPEVKSLNYIKAVKWLAQAKEEKAVEVLYLDDQGRISEATTSNFFAVIEGALITPRKNILFGITRKVVLEIAKKIKILVQERELKIGDFEEAFLTASNKEIMPVVKIDDWLIGSGRVGKITKKIMAEFARITHQW